MTERACTPFGLFGVVTVISLAVALSCSSGCRCGHDAPHVARLVAFVPVTEISVGGAGWAGAQTGAKLRTGDALRTGEKGTATIDIIGHGSLEVSPSSLVRFTAGDEGDEGQLRLAIETGALEAEVSTATNAPLLVIDGPTGRLRLHRGSKATLSVETERQLRLALIVGDVEIESPTGRPASGAQTVTAGQTVVLTVDEAGQLATEVVSEESAADAGPPDAGTAPTPASVPDADLPDAQAEVGTVTVRLRSDGGARLEVRPPGEEEYRAVAAGRAELALGAGFRVVGDGSIDIVGSQGARLVVHNGASGVLLGSDGGQLRARLAGGGALARGSPTGAVVLSVPGGQVSTGRIGARSALRLAVLDATSTRVNVAEGVADVVTAGGSRRAETGVEVVLQAGRAPSMAAPREIQPVLGGGSGIIYDANKRGGFTARFQPIEGCKIYSVDLHTTGKGRTAVVVGRPWIAVDNAPYGTHRWTVTCAEGNDDEGPPPGTREGRITRAADGSGRKNLPSAAPRNSLDTTGRTYAVMYQNRPPALTLRWSKAPPAASYQLQVRHTSGRVVHTGSHGRASHSFRSGFFRDGEYYWFWRAAGVAEGATSPVARVRVAYDQQTPAVYIAEPANGAAAGGAVRVRGEAAAGSSVSVNGIALDLTDNHRFDQEVPASGGVLVFRVTTPGRGTGLYLRHLHQ